MEEIMPLPIEYELFRTKDSNEFENIVCDVCIKRFGRDFQRYGRNGQKQFGIDIITVDSKESICVQCKNYVISEKDIRTIIDKAMQFNYPISKFIIATNSSRDMKLQDYVIEMYQQYNINFDISIMFWEEISTIISQHEDLLSKYYPKMDKNSIEWLISEFNRLMNRYKILGFVNINPVVGMPEYYIDQYELFYVELGEKLIQVNNLQKHSKFVAINLFRNRIQDYCFYLSLILYPTGKDMFTMNKYCLKDVGKIRKEIYDYKSELDKLYGQINEGCSIFLVRQY